MIKSLLVRHAFLSDLQALAFIEHNVFKAHSYHLISKRQYRYLLTKANAHVWLAELEDVVCGSCIVLFKKNSRRARLYSFSVLPNFQKNGIGTHLLSCIQDELLNQGILQLSLEVRADNARLIHYYVRHGFKQISCIPCYYPDNESGLKLVKDLI